MLIKKMLSLNLPYWNHMGSSTYKISREMNSYGSNRVLSLLGSDDSSCDAVAVMVDTPIENSPVTQSPVLSGLMDQVRTSSPDKGCVPELFFNFH